MVPSSSRTRSTRSSPPATEPSRRPANVESSDYATAARTPDGKLAIAYLPTVRTITIDASKLAANAVSRWYDPTAGTFTPAAPLSRNGSIETFRPPDKNSAGDGDWLLVLTAG